MPAYPEDSGSGSEYEDDQNVKAQSRKRGRGVKATVSTFAIFCKARLNVLVYYYLEIIVIISILMES